MDDGIDQLRVAELDMNQPMSLAPVQVAANGPLVVRASGLQPASDVLVIRNSDPATLGAFTTDEDGTLHVAVRRPEDTPRGRHTIDVQEHQPGRRAGAPAAPASGTNKKWGT